jgi:hypothetical protein
MDHNELVDGSQAVAYRCEWAGRRAPLPPPADPGNESQKANEDKEDT